MSLPRLLHLIGRAERGTLTLRETQLLREGVQQLAREHQVFRAEIIRQHDQLVRLAADSRSQPVVCPLWQAPLTNTATRKRS